MKKETLELIAADMAFDAAYCVFEQKKKEWIAEGKPSDFADLDRAAMNFSRRLVDLRHAINDCAMLEVVK
jgi:hypothetical protein